MEARGRRGGASTAFLNASMAGMLTSAPGRHRRAPFRPSLPPSVEAFFRGEGLGGFQEPSEAFPYPTQTDSLTIDDAAGLPGVCFIAWLVAPMALMAMAFEFMSNLTACARRVWGNESPRLRIQDNRGRSQKT